MANGYSDVTLVGYLGGDPESRQVGDTQLATFSLAVTTGTKDKPKTSWFRVNAWGGSAGPVLTYLQKGSKVLVNGEITVSTYETKDGGKGTSVDVRASNVVFLDNKTTKVNQENESSDVDYDYGDTLED
jgi:single-strand DNA-binding protein